MLATGPLLWTLMNENNNLILLTYLLVFVFSFSMIRNVNVLFHFIILNIQTPVALCEKRRC